MIPAASILHHEPNTFLVVDDNEMNREVLNRRLERQGYQVKLAENGKVALDYLAQNTVDLMFLDIMMPVMDGYAVLKHMKASERLRDIPVIVISALDQIESAVQCIELGAEDYLTKPFNSTLLNARINSSLEKKRWNDKEKNYRQQIEAHNHSLEQQVLQQVLQITQAQQTAIFAMSKLAESRDPETGEHLERLREYCRLILQELRQLPKYQQLLSSHYIEGVCAASPLHDIGKVGVPDYILLKPGSLTEDEWKIMRTHPVIGAQTLRAVEKTQPNNEFIRLGIEIAESHHEKWDGTGYPQGLKGEQIPLSARILALGDVYDALRSKRPYKMPFSHEKAYEIILQGKNSHFDPEVSAVFEQHHRAFDHVWRNFKDPE